MRERRFIAIAAFILAVAGSRAAGADISPNPVLKVCGIIRVSTLAKDDPRVLKVQLIADDGRVYMLDPVENAKAPARMDGQRVEIHGVLEPGVGGGPFLTVKQLVPLR